MLFFMIVMWTGFAMLFATITYFLFTRAVIFARGTVALLLGLAFSQQYAILVPTNSFLNCVAWIAICLCAIYTLSMLPRLDVSIRFCCTLFISLVGLHILIDVNVIGSIINKDFQVTAAMEIFTKILCVAVSVLSICFQEKKLLADFGANIFIRSVDRLLAAYLYGISASLLISPIHNQWPYSSTVGDVVLVVVMILMYVLDVFLAKKLLFGYTPPQKIQMPK